LVRCKKNLYVKYLSDITVECEGSVFIGFYCINSNVRAKQVIVESPKGRITGGCIDADIRVSAAEIGNRAESRTVVRVRGFDRNSFRTELDDTIAKLDENKNMLTRIKQHLQVYTCASSLSAEQKRNYENLKVQYANVKDIIKELEYNYKNLNDFLKTPGEGAITAKTRIYPKVRIEVRGSSEEIISEKQMITYYYRDNELKTM
ncbi:MAG: FapA family protein, partial [Clostridia bacterium]|nr:FapA family protein [Clostridia bacterium]